MLPAGRPRPPPPMCNAQVGDTESDVAACACHADPMCHVSQWEWEGLTTLLSHVRGVFCRTFSIVFKEGITLLNMFFNISHMVHAKVIPMLCHK